MSSKRAFIESLPKKRMGAGCLFFDEHGRVMLVKPTYKPVWEIPGGIVELNESPRQCCQREVREEIGMEREIGDLLAIDYNSQTSEKTESLMFIFDGGVLTQAEIESIRLLRAELSEFDFFTSEGMPAEMTDSLRKRVRMAWKQVSEGKGIYLEDQQAVCKLR